MSDNLTNIHKRVISTSSTISKIKNLEDLDIMDSFLFEGITENIDDAIFIARTIIRRVCGHTVEHLIVETEKQLKGISLNKRGIRMDILATEREEEKTLRIYDIEPNKYEENNLGRRSRYYQALIDAKLLSTDNSFNELPDSISIWILPYDPFGDDRMLYTVKNMVVENNHLVYNDGVTKLFLYTHGTKGGSKELKELLTFMENTIKSNAVDEELQEIQKIVDRIKSKNDVKERYMTLQEVIDYEKRDSYNEGVEAGRSEGIELGIQGIIATCKNFDQDQTQTKMHLMNQLQLTEEKADEYINLYW
jgi:predicted transposase/invertase (TIGR01784 family)